MGEREAEAERQARTENDRCVPPWPPQVVAVSEENGRSRRVVPVGAAQMDVVGRRGSMVFAVGAVTLKPRDRPSSSAQGILAGEIHRTI